MSKFFNILIAALLSTVLFILLEPTLYKAFAENAPKKVYEVETQVDEDGYRQILIRDQDGNTKIATKGYTTHSNPSIDGETVVWMAQVNSFWQIFLYDIASGKTVQLTNTNNNVNPVISGNNIAWEGLVNGTWQIFLFDGVRSKQVTDNSNPKQDVAILGNELLYSEKNGETWEITKFSILDKTKVKLDPNSFGRKPRFSENKIVWDAYEDEKYVQVEYDLSSKNIKRISKDKVTPQSENTEEDINAPEEPKITNKVEEPKTVTEEEIEQEMSEVGETIEEIKQVKESTPSVNEPSVPESSESAN